MRTKHIPSGILLVYLGKDNKPHTKSIPVGFNEEMTKINAKTELVLLQLDYMGREYLTNSINSEPIITMGLTRKEAKQTLINYRGSQIEGRDKMTIPRTPRRGGARPIQLSLKIREYLQEGPATGYELHRRYKEEMQQYPYPSELTAVKSFTCKACGERQVFPRKRLVTECPNCGVARGGRKISKKRHVISYTGFMHYLWVLRRLELVDYLRDESGEPVEYLAHAHVEHDQRDSAPTTEDIQPARPFVFVRDSEAWNNPQKYYLESL